MSHSYKSSTIIKKLFIISVFFSATLANAETWVYFGNNTDYAVDVNTTNTVGGLGSSYWTNNAGSINARNGDFHKVTNPIAKFNRNKGLGYNKVFEFDTTLTIQSKTVTFTTWLKSCYSWPCSGSSIKTKIKGPNSSPNTSLSDDYTPHTFTFTLSNGQTIQAQYRQYNTGTGDDQIYLVLNQDHPNNYVASGDITKENVIDVINYNTWMPRHMANEASYRKNEIPFHLKPFDIIVLEEVFNDDYRNDMRAALNNSHPFWTGPLNQPSNQHFSDDGGVAILSKWPIATDSEGNEIKDSITYSHCPCGFNNEYKGAWYVKILKHGTPYHIFGTHTVWDSSQAANIDTMEQITELGKFIAKKNIPANEAVIIAGDMNVFQHKPIYNTMLSSLNAQNPSNQPGVVLTNSHDESRNDGTEGGTGTLDYVLYSKAHKQPISSYVKVLPFMSPQTNDNNGYGGYLLGEYLSDHFAKHGHFVFTANNSVPNYVEIKSISNSSYTFSYQGSGHSGWVGVYREGDTPGQQSSYTWQYTSGTSGEVTLNMSTPGKYKAYLFYDNGYNRVAGPIYFNKI
ncbi:sphingomyelin phosphodiesterase [Spartinivicinus poritis]|uniref:Sphingomyelin phosphodiesterase n=1 Tax=Spartinivicinus poritis TaxID=2994640 RepID=A0ABT5UHM6_9GAMM|nr:sphingomyelin phosphodiesterase [Spartinivicinus sp. A2-2]MDE1465875.1 sphingomyelin phosphodiesterase [Spartinivicinus sp. A2-2]